MAERRLNAQTPEEVLCAKADYILRKNLEGPPEARRKFIGEHNA